jgi:hypothetical protein
LENLRRVGPFRGESNEVGNEFRSLCVLRLSEEELENRLRVRRRRTEYRSPHLRVVPVASGNTAEQIAGPASVLAPSENAIG